MKTPKLRQPAETHLFKSEDMPTLRNELLRGLITKQIHPLDEKTFHPFKLALVELYRPKL